MGSHADLNIDLSVDFDLDNNNIKRNIYNYEHETKKYSFLSS